MSCCSEVMKPIEASSCCTSQDTAAQAAKAMRSSDCGCVPVVEDTSGFKLVGVITERDLCHAIVAEDVKASAVGVKEIMRPATACCEMDEPVTVALQKLHEHRATSLLIVDQAGSCCGMISAHDLEIH